MKQFADTAQKHIDADPAEVFSFITDVARLPEWNRAIDSVLERPSDLRRGVQWTVRMQPHRFVHWGSRSTVDDLDEATHRFAYRTVNTDGNPSYSVWSWEVRRQADGCEVSVRWEVHLKTLDRRLLAGPIRRRELRHEVKASLVALGAVLAETMANDNS